MLLSLQECYDSIYIYSEVREVFLLGVEDKLAFKLRELIILELRVVFILILNAMFF